jgi:ATP-binding cassette subfamily B protein
MQLNSISIMDLVAYGGAALGIALSLIEFRSGAITITECFFIIMISAEFFLPLRMLGSFFHIAMNGNAAADKIFRLLDTEEQPDGTVNEVAASGIEFKNVTFGYDSEKTVLKDISFTTLDKGITALVGTSGCGKSTITSLVMKEQTSAKGEIRLGGVPLNDVSNAFLYKKITRITHDSYIFKGTVRNNLLMGNPLADEDKMNQALEQVELLSFVRENGGLDMEILEKGANLSGGQKQRLALARALLHDSDIYIFDEATSNVDVESENEIMNVVRNLSKEKSVILISHRLANVVNSGKILYMENGKIKESGTHEELYALHGGYFALYEKQRELEDFGKESGKEA